MDKYENRFRYNEKIISAWRNHIELIEVAIKGTKEDHTRVNLIKLKNHALEEIIAIERADIIAIHERIEKSKFKRSRFIKRSSKVCAIQDNKLETKE